VTQEQLADATGLIAMHTNRILQTLRREGLIQLNSRSLTVLNWRRLKEGADFDELFLHSTFRSNRPNLRMRIPRPTGNGQAAD
jgi:hypothetical protein